MKSPSQDSTNLPEWALLPFRTVLIDDEPWIVEGLKVTFEWSKWGFEISGAFTNPETALDFIFAERPDVVLTDIRMPLLSGIELMEKVRAAGLDTIFVVVSGYSDFNYALQAIRQGAFDYILKPLDASLGDQLLPRIHKILLEKRNAKDRQIIEWLMNSVSARQPLPLPELFGWKTFGLDFRVFSTDLSAVHLWEHLSALPYQFCVVPQDGNSSLVILNGSFPDSFDADIPSLSAGLTGISQRTSDLSSLPQLAEQARIAYYSLIWYGCSDSLHSIYQKPDWHGINALIQRLLKCIESRNEKQLTETLDSLREEANPSLMNLAAWSYLWNQLLYLFSPRAESTILNKGLFPVDWQQLLYEFYREADSSQSPKQAPFEMLLSQTKKDLLNRMQPSNTAPEVYSPDHNDAHHPDASPHMAGIMQYMMEHYDEEISLQKLSDVFFLNPNYISSLFRQSLGNTFIGSLNSIRIEEACRLLTQTDWPIAEVAEKVGYSDYFYFSKIFRRLTGRTASAHRFEKSAERKTAGETVQ